MVCRSLLVLLAWLLMACPVAWAAEATPEATQPATEPAAQPFISDADWNRSRAVPATGTQAAPAPAGKAVAAMAISLAVVLALAIGSVFLLRRVSQRRGGPTTGRHLELVETVHLGVKRSVVVLRLGEHVVLIGQSEQGLSGLGTFPASALAARPEPPPGVPLAAVPLDKGPLAGASPFAALLDKLTGKRR